MNGFKIFNDVYKVFTGVAAGYLAMKLLDEKTDDLLLDGGGANAFMIGAGQGAISMAVGVAVAKTIEKIM